MNTANYPGVLITLCEYKKNDTTLIKHSLKDRINIDIKIDSISSSLPCPLDVEIYALIINLDL